MPSMLLIQVSDSTMKVAEDLDKISIPQVLPSVIVFNSFDVLRIKIRACK